MTNPTSNYNFQMPTSTDLVTDLPADFEVFGQAVDTQMKTNADAATQKATLTTKGDIYAATGTSTPARLAVGANDTVLTADSTAATGLKWAAVAGGGMTVIASGSLSGSAVNLTSIPGTYKNLQLVIRDFSSLHDGDNLRFRFNNDSTNNRYLVKQTSDGSAATAFNENRGVASANQDDSVRDGLIVLDVYDYANSSTWKLSQAQAVTNDNTTTTSARHWNASIYYNQTAAITEINLVALIADFNNGTYILYGVN